MCAYKNNDANLNKGRAVLFVDNDREHERDCNDALERVRKLPDDICRVVPTSDLPRKPEWLTTIPCVVTQDHKRRLIGTSAIDYLDSLVELFSTRGRGSESVRKQVGHHGSVSGRPTNDLNLRRESEESPFIEAYNEENNAPRDPHDLKTEIRPYFRKAGWYCTLDD